MPIFLYLDDTKNLSNSRGTDRQWEREGGLELLAATLYETYKLWGPFISTYYSIILICFPLSKFKIVGQF
jgi:hypothetical protein